MRITDLLFRAGLPLTFPGRIKIYAGESGDSYGAAIPVFGLGGLINGIGPAFTQQIANTFRQARLLPDSCLHFFDS